MWRRWSGWASPCFANVSDETLADLYRSADAYMGFSKWEGYNLGISQALAMGLPTLGSDIPAHREFPIATTNSTLSACAWLAGEVVPSGRSAGRSCMSGSAVRRPSPMWWRGCCGSRQDRRRVWVRPAWSTRPRSAFPMGERQLHHQLQMCHDDLRRARLELAATRADASALATRLHEALLHSAELDETVARQQDTRATSHLDRAGEQRLHLEIQALQHHRAEAHAMRHSLSWRITRPLRGLRRLLRGRGGIDA